MPLAPTRHSTPDHVYQHPSGYIFRYRVPKDLQAHIPQTEFRYSLRTGSLRVAKLRAKRLFCFVEDLLNDLKRENVMPTREEIRSLVRSFIQDMLNKDLEERTAGVHYAQKFKGTDYPPQDDVMVEWMEEYDQEARTGQYSRSSQDVDKLLQTLPSLSISNRSHDYKRFCHEMARQMFEAYRTVLRRNNGDLSDLDAQALTVEGPSSLEKSRTDNGPALSKVVSLYFEANAHLALKTVADYQAVFGVLLEVVGDQPIKVVDRPMMRRFESTIQRLPPNREKRPEFKERSIAEIVEMGVPETLSTRSINKYLSRVSTLFNFAQQEGMIDMNPAKGLGLKQSRRPHEERAAFDIDDLTKLFHSPGYLKDTFRHSYMFWMPVLALFTGARLNELCQLHLDDFREVGGLVVMSINDEGVKKLKTKSSNRIIPLHPFLVHELDLPGRIKQLSQSDDVRLFPELKLRRDGYGQDVSKWFNERYRRECGVGVDGGPQKVFHSFRHNFINALKQALVNPDIVRELDGHKGRDMTMDRYGKPFTPDTLYHEAIVKLSFDGLDLSHLCRSKWAGK